MARLVPVILLVMLSQLSRAQFELFDPKGKQKVKVETISYHATDSALDVHVLSFNKQGQLIRMVKYDQANEALETFTYSYKNDKNGKPKSQSGSFKDHTKVLKPYKFKATYTYDKSGRLSRYENTKTGKGFELAYDSVGQLKERSDFGSKGFFSGSGFTNRNGRIEKEKFVLSGKAAEFTEYFYDGEGRLTKTLKYRAKALVEKRTYTYF